MSYQLDLDEIPEHSLLAEINRRMMCRRTGVCDYCGRYTDEPTCKFPQRHSMAITKPEEPKDLNIIPNLFSTPTSHPRAEPMDDFPYCIL